MKSERLIRQTMALLDNELDIPSERTRQRATVYALVAIAAALVELRPERRERE